MVGLKTVNVGLGERSYKIRIEAGSIANIGQWMRGCKVDTNPLVIFDQNVFDYYGNTVLESLKRAGFSSPRSLVLAPGEKSKSAQMLDTVYTAAIQSYMDRKDPVVAVGGGVIGDLAGYAAATYLRGVPFFQVPTSLLAQVDSSVGGKVAINHPLGKNLIGAFYQPAGVLIDPAVLTTLPRREYLSGLAEVLKYGFIADSDFLQEMRDNKERVLARESGVLEAVIAKCCEIKASFVEKDEKETGVRVLLNFGHTAGHAWEAAGGFETFLHGEAVSLGMVCAARIGKSVGLTDEFDVKTVEEVLREFQLPVSIDNIDSDRMIAYMATDKKREKGNVRWVLLKKIGIAATCGEIPLPLVKEILEGMTIS